LTDSQQIASQYHDVLQTDTTVHPLIVYEFVAIRAVACKKMELLYIKHA